MDAAESKPAFRLPEQPSATELADMDRAVPVEAEAYLRWLETGEGPDPCEVALSR